MSPTPYAKPELPVTIGAWQIFCPACFDAAAARHPRYTATGLDFNHDHPRSTASPPSGPRSSARRSHHHRSPAA